MNENERVSGTEEKRRETVPEAVALFDNVIVRAEEFTALILVPVGIPVPVTTIPA